MRTVLASVTNKSGLDSFLRKLESFDELHIIATSSTAQFLQDQGFPCTRVEELTGFPEILSGRVKTLHPRVFAGILARPSKEDRKCLEDMDISEIDIVVVNLYAFEEKLKAGLDEPHMIEQIDVGGVALLRAAAKNFERVTVLSDPSQYGTVLAGIEKDGTIDLNLRKQLARDAFLRTANYDRSISSYLTGRLEAQHDDQPAELPERLSLTLQKHEALRYGENPHQAASWYSLDDASPSGAVRNGGRIFPPFEQLQGKEMSANNITDTYALVTILRDIESPGVCIIKHNNPCGVAIASSIEDAYDKAYNTDPLSAFGGVYGFTQPLSAALASKITENFVEIVLAPEFESGALDVFKKKKNVRVLRIASEGLKRGPASMRIKDLEDFGFLIDKEMEKPVRAADFKCVTAKRPDAGYARDLDFGWAIVKHLTSNAIFVARNGCSLGFGIGQTSRIASVDIALKQAGESAKGAVLFSDAFFPATDNIESAAKAGIAVIVQPGGSIKDDEVIAACDKAGIAMLFTGQRCFKH